MLVFGWGVSIQDGVLVHGLCQYTGWGISTRDVVLVYGMMC